MDGKTQEFSLLMTARTQEVSFPVMFAECSRTYLKIVL